MRCSAPIKPRCRTRRYGNQPFCEKHYRLHRRTGRFETRTPSERFWPKVNRRSIKKCWYWTGTKMTGGYGSFFLDGKKIGAHRFAYEDTFGPIPPGYEIDHNCHNLDKDCPGGKCKHRACCNPHHLDVVTGSENGKRASYKRPRGKNGRFK
jgi:hypothetical protein